MNQISIALKLSRLIQDTSPSPSENDVVAIAYAIRNRLERGDTLDDILAESSLTDCGQNSCAAPIASTETNLKSVSLVTGVFAGLYDDPTRGATRFHRHDQTPRWAQGRVSNALLGPYIYYGEEST